MTSRAPTMASSDSAGVWKKGRGKDYKKTSHHSLSRLSCQHLINLSKGYQTNRHYCYSFILFDNLYNSQKKYRLLSPLESSPSLPSMRRVFKSVPSAPRRDTGPCLRRSEDTLVNRDGMKNVVRKALGSRTFKPEKSTLDGPAARKGSWVPKIGRLDSITTFQFFPLNPY